MKGKKFYCVLLCFGLTTALSQQETNDYSKSNIATDKLHDFGSAITDYDAACATNFYNLGTAYLKNGDWEKALTNFNKAIDLNPKLARAYNNRGSIKVGHPIKNEIYDQVGALTDFNKSIELEPDFLEPYINRGRVKKAEKDFDGALKDFNRAIEIKPDDEEAYVFRGQVKIEKNDLDGAVSDMNVAIKLNQNNKMTALAYGCRSAIERHNGDLKSALADSEKAIALDPESKNYKAIRETVQKQIQSK